jgi:NTP pyrophosphatase (non-canonical NTP hydrolase)
MNYETASLVKRILKFRDDRDWSQYHDPKNLSQAIGIEAAELQEIFLWKTTDESRKLSDKQVSQVKGELADIFIFMTYMCDEFKINLFEEVEKKLLNNEVRYPIEKSKGSSKKYNEL